MKTEKKEKKKKKKGELPNDVVVRVAYDDVIMFASREFWC